MPVNKAQIIHYVIWLLNARIVAALDRVPPLGERTPTLSLIDLVERF